MTEKWDEQEGALVPEDYYVKHARGALYTNGTVFPTVAPKIIDAIKMGCSINKACEYAGIDTSTYYRWKAQFDAKEEGLIRLAQLREFFLGVRQAIGERSVRWLATIEQAATKGDWKAAAWKLERLDDAFLPPSQRVQLDVPETTRVIMLPDVADRTAILAALNAEIDAENTIEGEWSEE